jgi:hypothetical protein
VTNPDRSMTTDHVPVAIVGRTDDVGSRAGAAPWMTAVTPPGEVHSVHNEGKNLAMRLTAQDVGVHRYAPTMGFLFASPADS